MELEPDKVGLLLIPLEGCLRGFGPPPYAVNLTNDKDVPVEMKTAMESTTLLPGQSHLFDGSAFFNGHSEFQDNSGSWTYAPFQLNHELASGKASEVGPVFDLHIRQNDQLSLAQPGLKAQPSGFPLQPESPRPPE